MVLNTNLSVKADDEPECPCDELEDDEQAECYDSGICTRYDVPVNGSVWVLVVAGSVLFVAGKRRLEKKSAL